jgi:ATP-dependent Clp protease adaptor protein ClpS
MSQFKVDEDLLTRQKLKPPVQYKVLLHNDDYTTMEFVVLVLEAVFHKGPAEATQIMLQVHKNGVGTCGIYSYEVAETKVEAVHEMARQHEFPLKASMEEV